MNPGNIIKYIAAAGGAQVQTRKISSCSADEGLVGSCGYRARLSCGSWSHHYQARGTGGL